MSNATRDWWRDRATQAAQHAGTCDLSLTPVELGNPCGSYAELSLAGMDGEPIRARLVKPAGEGPHPVILMFHDANRGVRGWHHMTRFVALGYASCWYEGHITDDDRICDRMAQELGVPDDYELVCYLPVGKPDRTVRGPAKAPFAERAWFNAFGSTGE